MSYLAKINIVDDTNAATQSISCSLPVEIAKQLKERYGLEQMFYVEFLWQHGGNLYSPWSGSISRGDMVEIPRKLVLMAANINEKSQSTSIICSGDLVQIRPMTWIGNAVQVFLKPLSAYDWEIISANASRVEESLLRTLSVVFAGQNLRIEINSTLVAKFFVTRIETELSLSLSQELIASVARITNRSSLVVEPITLSNLRTVFPCTTLTATASAVGEEGYGQIYMDSVLRLISPYSALQSLRTLPQCFRHCNTDFLLRPFYSTQASENGSIDCLDMFLSDSTNESDNETLADDENTVIVHPLYLKTALDILLRLRGGPPIAPMDFSSKGIADVTIIGQLFKDKANLASPNLLVKVRVSENVRPYHISVPSNARKVLSISDYQRLFLKIVDDTMKAAISPTKITLTLASKIVRTPGQRKTYFRENTPRFSIAESTATLNAIHTQLLEATKVAFVRLVDTETVPNGVFLLSTGQIISLSLPCEQFDSSITTSSSTHSHATQIQKFDFIVQIDGKEALSKPLDSKRSTPEGCGLLSPSIPNYTIVTSICKTKAQRMGITLQDCTDVLSIVAETSGAKDSKNSNGIPSFQHVPDGDYMWDNRSEELKGSYIGLEETISNAIAHISSQLLPLATRDSLYYDASPTVGMIVTGGRGCGKSNVLSELSAFFTNNPRCVVHSEIFCCGDISDKPLFDILKALTEVFQRAEKCAPSLILLDDLDKICSSMNDNEAHDHSGSGEKFVLTSLHLKRLLQCSLDRATESFEAAKRVCTNNSSHRNCFYNCDYNSKYCVSESLAGSQERLCYHVEEIVSLAQSRKVFVVAAAESITSIAVELTSYPHFLLGDKMCIQPFTCDDRALLLQFVLEKLGNQLDDEILNSSTAMRDELNSIMEGFTIADVKNFAKRISAVVFSQLTVDSIFSNLNLIDRLQDASYSHYGNNKQLFSTGMADIIEAAKNFEPISATRGGNFDRTYSNTITWKDIGGFDAVKSNVLGVLRLPTIFRRLYQRVPVRLPRAILLYGPPGCGKTAIAQAAGNDFGKNGFVCVRGPQLLDKYIGESEKAVRELFSTARRSGRPTLLFFDEFESLAAKRGKDNTGVTDRVVNQLLTFIDGVEDTMGSGTGTANGSESDDDDDQAQRNEPRSDGTVFLIVASSRPDLIDPALLRPGRIEKHIFISMPNVLDRVAILSNALQPGRDGEFLLDEQVMAAIEFVARSDKASCMTPADLKAVISTANLIAAHEYISSVPGTETGRRRHAISHRHILNAFAHTKPSLSAEDLRFYNSIYSKFQPDRSSQHRSQSSAPHSEDKLSQQRMSLK